ncbi:Pectate lyase [Marinobacter daqiaonensis]|uniref:Pectate lyase n=1 Tax=Marinobacter daqiaonensis TaxID=650891 RepID=A0A1I6IFD2_9GAMM|nr:CBM35 domain-containing protein [Marinobacter daqiaonensis]SFR65406.1 Pectate lyase [Marinobacter daqiaonensis]
MRTLIGSTLLTTVLALASPTSHAVASGPVGFASLNGGTTGGAGGETVTVRTGAELYDVLKEQRNSDTPLTVLVEGRITPDNTGESKIDLKDVRNVTVLGAPGGAEFDGIGIKLSRAHNIIIRNLIIHHVDTGDKDAISVEGGSSNIWIDHNELYASLDVDKDHYDGLLDTKRGSEYITISYNYFHDSWKASLHGSSDSDQGQRLITFHHNRWENINSRAPLFRFGEGHIFNNYYYNVIDSGINSRMSARLRIENNHFENANNPIVSFYSDEIGFWDLTNNFLDGVYWNDNSGPVAGEAMVSTTRYQPPYRYTLDDITCVRDIVMATAGAGKGLRTSDGSCEATTPVPPTTPTPDPTPEPPEPEQPKPEQPGSPDPGMPDPNPGDRGENLSLSAGADGSSKASGSSYGNAIDGDTGSFWQPASTSGERISVKRMAPFNTVVIRELNDATRNWRLVNHETGEVLASGQRLGTETTITGLGTQNIYKLDLEILNAAAAPRIAEIELYNAAPGTGDNDSGSPSTPDQGEPEPQQLVLEENQPGFCGVDGVIESEHAGFSGAGYANTSNVYGTGVAWQVNVAEAGHYDLVVRFANGATARSGSLYVNDRWVTAEDFRSTGAWNSYRDTAVLSVTLGTGANRIALRATNDSGLPNIDRIQLEGLAVSAVDCN